MEYKYINYKHVSPREFWHGDWIRVIYPGSRHFMREGHVETIGKCRLTVVFVDHHERTGMYVHYKHAKTICFPL